MPKALAFSNNDIAVFAWSFEQKLKDCLGFAVYRGDVHAGTWEPLPALARFEATQSDAKETTEQAPVQKYWWKDLGARRGGMFRYRIVPMGGTPGALQPLAGVDALVTNPVAITPDRGLFKAYFNRGILATQMVAHALGTPSVDRLLRHIADPKDSLRQALEGQLEDALTELLDQADDKGGEIRAALYELNDPQGLEVRLQASDHGSPAARAVILGNERAAANRTTGEPATDDTHSENRANLKAAGVPVTDRILPSGHIPHNKFLVLKQADQPVAVLTGSTNWTMNALAAQTNNALLISSPAVAAHYSAYWDELERDTGSAQRGDEAWQGPTFRQWTQQHNEALLQQPLQLEDGSAIVQMLFSPNTNKGDHLAAARGSGRRQSAVRSDQGCEIGGAVPGIRAGQPLDPRCRRRGLAREPVAVRAWRADQREQRDELQDSAGRRQRHRTGGARQATTASRPSAKTRKAGRSPISASFRRRR